MLHIVSVVLLLVTAWSGSASAECAWMLWSKQAAVTSPSAFIPDWGIHSAYKVMEDCIKVLDEMAGVEPGKRARKTPTVVIAGGSAAMCLPDTVDRAGRRGK